MATLTQQRSPLNHPWRIASLVAVVTNATFGFAEAHLMPGPSVAEVSDRYANPSTPAGYAFAIWGLIYGATFAYAVFALLPAQLRVRMHDRTAPWLTLLNALAIAWILLFSAEQLMASLLVVSAMLAASAVCYVIASQHLDSERLPHWWRAPFSLWLGWIGVAAVANLGAVITAAGWDGMPISSTLWATLMVLLVAVAASIVNVAFGDGIVPLVVAWAAVAIAAAHFHESTLLGIVAAVVAFKATFWGATTFVLSLFPIPRHYRVIAARAARYSPKAA
jgi:hypothetical protein